MESGVADTVAQWVQTQVAKIDAYEIDFAHRGKNYADAKYEQTRSITPVRNAYQLLQLDHTLADVLLFITDGDRAIPVGRPFITVAIDVATRVVAGLYIGFEPPSVLSVAHCLHSVIMPKTKILAELGLDPNLWPAFGIPSVIETDNGREFLSEDFSSVLTHLGITHLQDEVRRPQSKPFVERFFGTLNRFIHRIPGTTFSNIVERGDYKSRSMVAMDFDAFCRAIVRFIAEEYHQDLHCGIGMAPLKKWSQLAAAFPTLPANQDDLVVLKAPKILKSHSLTKRGIEIFNLRYNSPDLGDIRSKKGDMKVSVRINPNNLNSVFVLNPETESYVEVPCTRPDIASGLTIQFLKMLKADIREHGDTVCTNTLLDARERISELLVKSLSKKISVGDAKRLARLLKIGTENLELELVGDGEKPAKAGNDQRSNSDQFDPEPTELPGSETRPVASQIARAANLAVSLNERPASLIS